MTLLTGLQMRQVDYFVTPCRSNPIASQAEPFVEYLSCFTHSDFLNVAGPSFDDLCRKQRKKSSLGTCVAWRGEG